MDPYSYPCFAIIIIGLMIAKVIWPLGVAIAIIGGVLLKINELEG